MGMGAKFNRFVRENFTTEQCFSDIEELKGTKIGVDATKWIADSTRIEESQNITDKAMKDDHKFRYILYNCRKLLEHGVHLVLVFDGHVPMGKVTMTEYKENRTLTTHVRYLPPDSLLKLKIAASSENLPIDFVHAPYESDTQLSFMAATKQIYAVITSDHDLVALFVPRIIFEWSADDGSKCRYYKLDNLLCAHPLLDQKQLLLAALLTGSDYNGPISIENKIDLDFESVLNFTMKNLKAVGENNISDFCDLPSLSLSSSAEGCLKSARVQEKTVFSAVKIGIVGFLCQAVIMDYKGSQKGIFFNQSYFPLVGKQEMRNAIISSTSGRWNEQEALIVQTAKNIEHPSTYKSTGWLAKAMVDPKNALWFLFEGELGGNHPIVTAREMPVIVSQLKIINRKEEAIPVLKKMKVQNMHLFSEYGGPRALVGLYKRCMIDFYRPHDSEFMTHFCKAVISVTEGNRDVKKVLYNDEVMWSFMKKMFCFQMTHSVMRTVFYIGMNKDDRRMKASSEEEVSAEIIYCFLIELLISNIKDSKAVEINRGQINAVMKFIMERKPEAFNKMGAHFVWLISQNEYGPLILKTMISDSLGSGKLWE